MATPQDLLLHVSHDSTVTRNECSTRITHNVGARSLQKALWRLQREKRLISPTRNLFVIVPTVYRSVGTPPPAWYLDAWMKQRGSSYYS
jgi:hypothetical protein